MKHGTHLYLMIGLAAVMVVVLSTGTDGGWVPFVWIGACVVMMFAMMRTMGGMGSGVHSGGMTGGRRAESEDELSRTAGRDRHR